MRGGDWKLRGWLCCPGVYALYAAGLPGCVAITPIMDQLTMVVLARGQWAAFDIGSVFACNMRVTLR